MKDGLHNFSPGPGALPESVLMKIREEFLALPGVGLPILEISHRSKWFYDILEEAESNLRDLLRVPDPYHVLFLQGGASLQFSMIPMNFLRRGEKPADYIVTGYWSSRAKIEAQKEGPINIAWSEEAESYTRAPQQQELHLTPGGAYVHYASNETIEGVQFPGPPDTADVPLFCDMSSDLATRPFDIERHALIYAHAQKNLGPAGVTIVILRPDMLERAAEGLGAMLDYRSYAQRRSLFNTPPVFQIYVVMLVSRWLRDEIGGLERMNSINTRKADILYETIDRDDFYINPIRKESRSKVNVSFRLADRQLEQVFLEEARSRGFIGLEGHRSVGGLRASLYNPLPLEDVQALCDFMDDFRSRQ